MFDARSSCMDASLCLRTDMYAASVSDHMRAPMRAVVVPSNREWRERRTWGLLVESLIAQKSFARVKASRRRYMYERVHRTSSPYTRPSGILHISQSFTASSVTQGFPIIMFVPYARFLLLGIFSVTHVATASDPGYFPSQSARQGHSSSCIEPSVSGVIQVRDAFNHSIAPLGLVSRRPGWLDDTLTISDLPGDSMNITLNHNCNTSEPFDLTAIVSIPFSLSSVCHHLTETTTRRYSERILSPCDFDV